MTDKKRIILMTKLAAYDKEHAHRDRKKAEFFRHDYVYRQNVTTRFFTLIGSLIVAFFYFLHRIVINGMDILNLEETLTHALIMGIFIVLAQVFYTLIGFWRNSRDYNSAQDRINEYYKNLNLLRDMLERERSADKVYAKIKEDAAGRYEPDFDGYFKD